MLWFVWWSKTYKTTEEAKKKKKTSMSRSDADTTRALPDGFFIPLLFSRSFAICDVKKPNLIVRSGQMSELTNSCHNHIFFSTCVQENTNRILKNHFITNKHWKKILDNLTLKRQNTFIVNSVHSDRTSVSSTAQEVKCTGSLIVTWAVNKQWIIKAEDAFHTPRQCATLWRCYQVLCELKILSTQAAAPL